MKELSALKHFIRRVMRQTRRKQGTCLSTTTTNKINFKNFKNISEIYEIPGNTFSLPRKRVRGREKVSVMFWL